MKYQEYDLGQLSGDDVVEVLLEGNAANVRLLDILNLSKFKSGRAHNYYGGHYTQSPIRIAVPHAGHWYVTIDLGDYGGSVKSSVSVL